MRELAALVLAALAAAPTHALWALDTDSSRQSAVRTALGKSAVRLTSEACGARASRLASSDALAFFEASAPLFFSDIAAQNVIGSSSFSSASTWIAGNLHPRSIRALPGAGADEVVLDVADMDDAWPSSYLIDVYHFAVGLELLARHNRRALYVAELTEERAWASVFAFVSSYAHAMERHATSAPPASDYAVSAATARDGALPTLLDSVSREPLPTARAALLSQLACSWSGGRGLRTPSASALHAVECGPANHALGDVDAATAAQVSAAVAHYAEHACPDCATAPDFPSAFTVLDVAEWREDADGSEGALAFALLLRGAPAAGNVLLEARLQGTPAPAPSAPGYVADAVRAGLPSNAERVALARRAALIHPDVYTGWLSLPDSACAARLPRWAAEGGCSFSVKEITPRERAFDIEMIDSAAKLAHAAQQWGMVVAAAHARADNEAAAPIGTLVGASLEERVRTLVPSHRRTSFSTEVASFAAAYADQVERDFAQWKERGGAAALCGAGSGGDGGGTSSSGGSDSSGGQDSGRGSDEEGDDDDNDSPEIGANATHLEALESELEWQRSLLVGLGVGLTLALCVLCLVGLVLCAPRRAKKLGLPSPRSGLGRLRKQSQQLPTLEGQPPAGGVLPLRSGGREVEMAEQAGGGSGDELGQAEEAKTPLARSMHSRRSEAAPYEEMTAAERAVAAAADNASAEAAALQAAAAAAASNAALYSNKGRLTTLEPPLRV